MTNREIAFHLGVRSRDYRAGDVPFPGSFFYVRGPAAPQLVVMAIRTKTDELAIIDNNPYMARRVLDIADEITASEPEDTRV